jgi:ankyrin repeat protein
MSCDAYGFQDGGTPLFVACQYGHLDVVEGLIERGASPNAHMKVEKL